MTHPDPTSSAGQALRPWKTDEQAKAEAVAAKDGMAIALGKLRFDLLDVLANLPVNDAKVDGVRFSIATIDRHLARLVGKENDNS